MARPIQALAPAFLNLLGLKNQGGLPPELADYVQPQVDMGPFYLQGQAINRQATVASTFPVVPTYGAFLLGATVPNNEWWYLHYVTARVEWVALPNNQSNIFGLAAAVVARNPSATLMGPQARERRTTDPLTFEWQAPSLRDTWAPPGSQIGTYASLIDVSDITPAQVWSATTTLRYTPVSA